MFVRCCALNKEIIYFYLSFLSLKAFIIKVKSLSLAFPPILGLLYVKKGLNSEEVFFRLCLSKRVKCFIIDRGYDLHFKILLLEYYYACHIDPDVDLTNGACIKKIATLIIRFVALWSLEIMKLPFIL